MTSGEHLFLMLFEEVGTTISVRGRNGAPIDFMLNERGFVAFTQLVATSEIFRRCVRASIAAYGDQRHLHAKGFAKAIRQHLDLPAALTESMQFCEAIKQVGRIASEHRRSNAIEAAVIEEESPYCFWCNCRLTKTGHSQRTIEHIWPLSLGGETIGENLLLACHDCNSKRNDMFNWALGPIQSTYHVHTSSALAETAKPPASVQFSLALVRLVAGAARTKRRKYPRTLKEAAKELRPLIPRFTFQVNSPYLYFELVDHIGEII